MTKDKVTCPNCGGLYATNNNHALRTHRVSGRYSVLCEGSGRIVLSPTLKAALLDEVDEIDELDAPQDLDESHELEEEFHPEPLAAHIDETSETDDAQPLTYTVYELNTPLFTTPDLLLASRVSTMINSGSLCYVKSPSRVELIESLLSASPSFEEVTEDNVEIMWVSIPLWVTDTLQRIWSSLPCYRPDNSDLLALPVANSPYIPLFEDALNSDNCVLLADIGHGEDVMRRCISHEMFLARNLLSGRAPHHIEELEPCSDPFVIGAILHAQRYMTTKGLLIDENGTAPAIWALLSEGTLPRANGNHKVARSVLAVLHYARHLLVTAPNRPTNIKKTSSNLNEIIDEVAARVALA